MFHRFFLNQHSRNLIDNIYVNTINHPSYSNYKIYKDEATYAPAGAIALILTSPKGSQNMFLFYPALDGSGRIGSCAIYGALLNGHKTAIERSMRLFGLEVESIKWDEGIERFLDVTLCEY